tara:strand:+ start:704 stop:910 length:207 start_codon:yes stop_codon:yes gene_type:complete
MTIYNFTADEDVNQKVISIEADDIEEAKYIYFMTLVEAMTEDQLYEIAARTLHDYFSETLTIVPQELH